MMCLVAVSVLSSCKEDYEMPDTGAPDGAEALAVGNYSGEWSITNNSTGAVVVSSGTIVITEKEYTSADSEASVKAANVNAFKVTTEGDLMFSATTKTKTKSSVWNISRIGSGALKFWNVDSKNEFGETFYGNISPEGEIEFNYSTTLITGRGGKNQTKYIGVFKGKKLSD